MEPVKVKSVLIGKGKPKICVPVVAKTAEEIVKDAEIPLLFTFRTEKEGGEKSLTTEDYIAINKAVIESGFVDLLDVELFTGDEAVEQMIDHAHRNQVKVIVSSHDFKRTPPKEELLKRLRKMQELGADIPKIAVMPQIKEDVLTLLAESKVCKRSYYHYVHGRNGGC